MKRTILAVLVSILAVASVVEADFSTSTPQALTGPGTTGVSLSYKGQLTGSLAMGAAEENSGQLFFEKSSVVTGSDLALTLGGTVPVGTSVRSYILHFDPVGRDSVPVYELHEELTFDERVLGVIFDTASNPGQLAATDSTLGLGAGFYESSSTHRKFEEGQDKWNDIAILGNSVTFNLFTNSSMDEVRIVTTPVPGAVLLGMLGLSAAGVRLRRFGRSAA